MADAHEDALRSLQILRRSLRSLRVQANGATMSVDDAYGATLADIQTVVQHHQLLSERDLEPLASR